jgi:HEAT repeat protein
MNNLQDLYETFIETRPSSAKIRNATSMMIHVCRALDISSQEEVTTDYFDSIPRALDNFYSSHPIKATLDKSILAEMIGRIGPKKKLRPLLDKLLSDNDENVRLFTLNSLEFCGMENPEQILPFIEKYRTSTDLEMRTTAASLAGNLQCSAQFNKILSWIKKWYDELDYAFVQETLERMVLLREQRKCDKKFMTVKEIQIWAEKNTPKSAKQVFRI